MLGVPEEAASPANSRGGGDGTNSGSNTSGGSWLARLRKRPGRRPQKEATTTNININNRSSSSNSNSNSNNNNNNNNNCATTQAKLPGRVRANFRRALTTLFRPSWSTARSTGSPSEATTSLGRSSSSSPSKGPQGRNVLLGSVEECGHAHSGYLHDSQPKPVCQTRGQFVVGGRRSLARPDASSTPRPQGRNSQKDDNQPAATKAKANSGSRLEGSDKREDLGEGLEVKEDKVTTTTTTSPNESQQQPKQSAIRNHRKRANALPTTLWPLRQRLQRARSKSEAVETDAKQFGEPFETPQASWMANAAHLSALARLQLACAQEGATRRGTQSGLHLSTAKILAGAGFRRRSYDDREGDNEINIIMQASDFQYQYRTISSDLKLAKSLLDQDYSLTVRLFISRSALNWNFNSFTFDAICCGRSLSELLLHLFDYYDLYRIFKLNIVNVLKCFRLLEFGYHGSNPYHNSVHAADVTQAMHCFMQETKIRSHMTHLETLCSIMAAVCHDLDHPGVNQSFLVATNNPLANLYNNDSVLENHHWRFAMCIFKESQLFDHFDEKVLDQFKIQLKNLILATDIARQNEYLKRFREMTSSRNFSMCNTDDRALVLQMALKCADLGNPCRPWLISRVWSKLICDEFYKMGSVERKLGIPLTPICQRDKTSIAGIQSDFFRFIVLPLLILWHKFLESPLSELLMSNFEHNYQRWQKANLVVQQLRRRKSIACLEHVSTPIAWTTSSPIARLPSGRPSARRLSRPIGAQ